LDDTAGLGDRIGDQAKLGLKYPQHSADANGDIAQRVAHMPATLTI
jgi:hypothetical protein